MIEPDAVHAPGLAAASASATTQDTYKWDAELKRYYRFLPGELPDFGTTFTNDCDDRLYARFQDDTVKELRGSVGDDLGKENSKGQKNGKNQGKSLSSNSVCPTSKKTKPSGSLHHVTQLDGGVKLYVRDRPDRGLLISIYENDVRQICQVSADKFDDKKLAIESMVDLAESVGKGEVNIGDMYPARDRKLIELGILSKSRKRKAAKTTSLVTAGVLKRPSIASDAPGLMENLDVNHDAVASIEITDGGVLCSDIPAGIFDDVV